MLQCQRVYLLAARIRRSRSERRSARAHTLRAPQPLHVDSPRWFYAHTLVLPPLALGHLASSLVRRARCIVYTCCTSTSRGDTAPHCAARPWHPTRHAQSSFRTTVQSPALQRPKSTLVIADTHLLVHLLRTDGHSHTGTEEGTSTPDTRGPHPHTHPARGCAAPAPARGSWLHGRASEATSLPLAPVPRNRSCPGRVGRG